MLVTGSRFLTSDKSSRAAGTRMLTVLLEKGRADQDTHCVSGEGTKGPALMVLYVRSLEQSQICTKS